MKFLNITKTIFLQLLKQSKVSLMNQLLVVLQLFRVFEFIQTNRTRDLRVEFLLMNVTMLSQKRRIIKALTASSKRTRISSIFDMHNRVLLQIKLIRESLLTNVAFKFIYSKLVIKRPYVLFHMRNKSMISCKAFMAAGYFAFKSIRLLVLNGTMSLFEIIRTLVES